MFACNFFFFFFCLLSPCALTKTTSGQNAVNIIEIVQIASGSFFSYELHIDAKISFVFSERKLGPKTNAVTERCFKLMLFNFSL